jgi:hypothetical protein
VHTVVSSHIDGSTSTEGDFGQLPEFTARFSSRKRDDRRWCIATCYIRGTAPPLVTWHFPVVFAGGDEVEEVV